MSLIKLIVSDLDGTLLQEDITVADSDRIALLEAIDEGFQVCIATGRNDLEIKEVLKSFNQNLYRISQNGAFAYSADSNAILHQVFELKTAKRIYDKVKGLPFVTLVSNFDTNFIEEDNEFLPGIQEKMFHPIIIDQEIANKFELIQPSKFNLMGAEEDLMKIQHELATEFQDEIDIFISAKFVLDIMPKQISKGNALKKVLDELKIKPNEIACIGDSFNDISMFELTPYSFAMSHAHDSVKEEASYVVNSVKEAVEIIRRENQSSHTKTLKI